MKTAIRGVILGAIAVVGCGGKVTVDGLADGGVGGHGGGGAGGSAGHGGAGSGGGAPSECSVPTSESGPYAVTFRFEHHADDQPLFLPEDCHLVYTVSSCADGYVAPIARTADCTLDCNDANGGCIQCGPCMQGAAKVLPASPVEDGWSGQAFTFSTTSEGCSCHTAHAAPAGKYRITVPVYRNEADVASKAPDWQVTTDFQLPVPGAVVVVSLDPPVH